MQIPTFPLPPHVSGCVVSDKGLTRPVNEDNYLLNGCWNRSVDTHSEHRFSAAGTQWQLAAVFDGMGGGEAGELASLHSAEIFQCCWASPGPSTFPERVDDVMRLAFREADRHIDVLRRTYRMYGTTGVALCTDGITYKFFHLGDSRAYLFRNQELYPLTKDHTLAQMKLDLGLYGPDSPAIQEDRCKLTQYIGCGQLGEDIYPQESTWQSICRGDRILLCSDGLYGMCSFREIRQILSREPDISECASALVKRANENGGEDNVTCLLLSFP